MTETRVPGSRRTGQPRRTAASDRNRASAHADDEASVEAAILGLQASAGNRAVTSMLTGGTPDGASPAVQRAMAAGAVVQRRAALLRQGSQGPEVRALQEALRRNGDTLAVDGIFGLDTKAAVMLFQGEQGLTVDGIVGPATRAALGMGGGGAGGGEGGAGRQRAIGHLVEEAVGQQIGAGHGGGPRGTIYGGTTTVPFGGGGTASGSIDTDTGAVSGNIETSRGGVSGGYDPQTGQGGGGVHVGGTNVTGSYDSNTGSGTGSVTTTRGGVGATWNSQSGDVGGSAHTSGGGSVTGSYNTHTGAVSGDFRTSGGTTSGDFTGNTQTGTGSGHLETQYGSGSVTLGDDNISATVEVPGVGSVSVDLDRPDWL